MLMGEAFSWIQLSANRVFRRLVSLRSQYDPMEERHTIFWRGCGETLQINDF